MMVGRIGRDKDSFNCGGHHGLVPYNAPFNGLVCDFCKGPILAGSRASGCRHGLFCRFVFSSIHTHGVFYFCLFAGAYSSSMIQHNYLQWDLHL